MRYSKHQVRQPVVRALGKTTQHAAVPILHAASVSNVTRDSKENDYQVCRGVGINVQPAQNEGTDTIIDLFASFCQTERQGG